MRFFEVVCNLEMLSLSVVGSTVNSFKKHNANIKCKIVNSNMPLKLFRSQWCFSFSNSKLSYTWSTYFDHFLLNTESPSLYNLFPSPRQKYDVNIGWPIIKSSNQIPIYVIVTSKIVLLTFCKFHQHFTMDFYANFF